MSPDEARDIARDRGLDLVEVAPNAKPPVCRIMDFGKFQYERSKKSSASKKSQVVVKTITLRPKTDTHDLDTKLKHARSFLEKHNRVKFVMRLRGRERAYPQLWVDKLKEVVGMLTDFGTVTQYPKAEGRTITAMMEPIASDKDKS
jgi:translation initiation factor IF-3